MLNANIKKVISVLTTVVFVFIIAGCSSPEERRAKSLAEAAQLRAEGENMTALELLETLAQKHPDDSEILQQIGLLQKDLGNYSEAAFYLGAAYDLSPDNQELLYQAYLAYETAGQFDTAYDLLKVFARTNPTAMTSTLWFRLGELHMQAKKTETALEAYLEGVKLIDEKPPAEIALAIGTLFKQLDNLPMAGRWFTIAAKSDDPSALPALFGILEIYLRSKNWEAAEKSIAIIDKKFPGAVDASKWANARVELEKWRANQIRMQQQREKLAQSQQIEQNKPSEKPAETTEKTADIAEKSEAPKSSKSSTDARPETSGKAQVLVDMANAEALADKPASKVEPEAIAVLPEEKAQTGEQTDSAEPAIVFNPNITIQPAEPDMDVDEKIIEPDVGVKEETIEIDLYIVDEPNSQQKQEKEKEKQKEQEQEQDILVDYEPVNQSNKQQPEPDTSSIDTTTLSLEEIINYAKEANFKGNYNKAIKLYRDALERSGNRADIWDELSKVYFINGQAKNAATTALEATRLDPDNIQYLLDYLRVAQRVKKPADFIKELEIAYDRFPRSPEITLSLARGYRRIGGNDYAAGILYKRFIQLAPKHPLRPEAEAELARMQ
jgi:tetratricopeptide (TPR) repeat protein